MARVTIILPHMLHPVAGAGRLHVDARTLREALEEAYRQIPALRHHLTEGAKFRPHVLCFWNGENTRDLGTLDVPLRAGDEIEFLQAVSGG